MSRDEIAKGIANRFVHSRTYIFLYLGMACLSVTTVVLSLVNTGCPTLPFYILEIIINGVMILEVAIRFVAFGRVRGFLIRVLLVPYSRSHLPTTAILEISFQHCGPLFDAIMHTNTGSNTIRWVWVNEQRGGIAGHAATSCAECSAVWATGGGDAKVRRKRNHALRENLIMY